MIVECLSIYLDLFYSFISVCSFQHITGVRVLLELHRLHVLPSYKWYYYVFNLRVQMFTETL